MPKAGPTEASAVKRPSACVVWLRPLALGLLLLIAGCVMTLVELREKPPARVGEFAVPYERLARCIQREFQSERGTSNNLVLKYDLDVSSAEDEARVFVAYPSK